VRVEIGIAIDIVDLDFGSDPEVFPQNRRRRQTGTNWERRLSAGFARRGLDAPGARPAALDPGDHPKAPLDGQPARALQPAQTPPTRHRAATAAGRLESRRSQ
jgi:hypothetical protein